MSEHIVSPKIYIVIFLCLMLGTGLTVWAAFQNFGMFNIVIALVIASIKATLVVLAGHYAGPYARRLPHALARNTAGCGSLQFISAKRLLILSRNEKVSTLEIAGRPATAKKSPEHFFRIFLIR